jgi:hypothetical protein
MFAAGAKNRKVMACFPDSDHGKHAITHYKVLERFGYVTVVECKLETGRTHQIRIHMRHLGHPLFNDNEYGGDRILKGLSSNKIVSYSNTANFKNLPIGEYTVCCLSFLTTYNPDNFINLNLDELYNISPCIQKSFNSFDLKVNENLSVSENDNKSFKLYPNPVKDILIYDSGKSIEKLEIYDIAGAMKKIKIIDYNKLDVSNLSKGVYILKVYFKNNISQTHKFIKE